MTAAPLPAAVLWDMDGTLIDTEPYWIAEERALIEAAGGSWSDDDALALVGSDLLVAAEIVLASTPVSGTAQQLVEQLVAGVVRRTKEHLPWRPGARELLDDCVAHGVPCALVTMSWTALAGLLVQALPDGTFAAVVTGDQVSAASRTRSPTRRLSGGCGCPRPRASPSRTPRPACVRRWPPACRRSAWRMRCRSHWSWAPARSRPWSVCPSSSWSPSVGDVVGGGSPTSG